MLDAWLRVDPNGTVTIFTGKIELGQGIGTALSQIAADELDVDLKRIEVVYGDTARTPNEGQTAGSLSVEQSGTALRFACAEAREILLSAAAAKLGVPAADLSVSDGTVTGAGGGRITYWDLTGDADLTREATATVKPKPAAAHRWVGTSVPRRDIPKKFTGGAAYVQDVRLPGMVFGRVVRPPSPGAELLSVDEARVRSLPGVVAVVRDGSFLAVAAAREEQAIRAREALRQSAKWKETASLPPSGDALYRDLIARSAPAETVTDKAAPAAAEPVKTLEARYTRPYQCHGSIGPSCAVAHWQDGRVTVGTHSQGLFPLRAHLAKAGGSDRNAIPLYDFGRVKVVKHYVAQAPLRTSALRTLGGYANVFALESFLDELAAAAGADPVEFRLRHLSDPRARAVLEAAAQRAGWPSGAKGDGARGRGVAFARYKNLACYCALVADVAVDRGSGRVRVARVVAAVDAGQIVNPDGIVNQIEGGIIQSTSWTLKESVRFDRTRVTTRSWADYPIVRFDEVPEVDVVLLDRPSERFLGVGEGAQGPAAAAIANALAHATGPRLRALPFTPARVKQALAGGSASRRQRSRPTRSPRCTTAPAPAAFPTR